MELLLTMCFVLCPWLGCHLFTDSVLTPWCICKFRVFWFRWVFSRQNHEKAPVLNCRHWLVVMGDLKVKCLGMWVFRGEGKWISQYDLYLKLSLIRQYKLLAALCHRGGLAQMVERSLSMWEVPGSIPGFSNYVLGPASSAKAKNVRLSLHIYTYMHAIHHNMHTHTHTKALYCTALAA